MMKHLYPLLTAIAVLLYLSSNAQTGGETCATSVTLPFPALAITGTTAGAANDYTEDCSGATILSDGADVVYDLTVPVTGLYDFSLCQLGTTYDTKFYIYDNCPPPGSGVTGTTIACDNDGCVAIPGLSEMLNVPLNAGTTYYLVIDGSTAGDEGTYSLSFAPAASPPLSFELVLDEARSYNYSRIPRFNLAASIFDASVRNAGTNMATGVSVNMTAYGPDIFTLIDHTDSSNPISIGPGATALVSGIAPWTPCDTGVYLLEYVVTATTSTGLASNDTIFQFLQVTPDIQSCDYSLFGEPLNSIKLLYESPDSEYGIRIDMNAAAELSSAQILLVTDPAIIGELVTASVYEIGVDINDLTLVATGVSPDLADPAQLVYEVPLAGTLSAGKGYVLAYKGSQFVVRTDQIYTQETSDLVRDPITTGGIWGFFSSPYAWSMELNMTEAPTVCNSAITPICLTADVTASTLELAWDPTPSSIGCRLNYGPYPGPYTGSRVLAGFEVSAASIPTGGIPPGNYKLRVQCACSIAPLDASAFSTATIFSIPSPKVSAFSTKVYPIPARDQLTVNYTAETKAPLELRIVSMMGEEVSTSLLESFPGPNQFRLDVSRFSEGVYFVEIGNEVIEFLVAR